MSNAIYDKGKEAFLNADIDLLNDTIKAVLVRDTYTPLLGVDQFYTPSINTHVHDVAQTLVGKTTGLGIFDAGDALFPAVPGGATINYIVIYKSTGVATQDRLIACIDTSDGLPFTPNGGDITVIWDNGANKIFKL